MLLTASVLRCEFFALWRRILLAWDYGHRDIVCETDNVDVFLAVQSHSSVSGAADSNLIIKIHDLIWRNWNVEVKLIQREANGVADAMAKVAARSQLSQVEWTEPW
ncbi:hypothetical protein PIB30_112658, partial [Stylosanthes scabra]|nr:hypothetical protein [Stylosanthes scabra]